MENDIDFLREKLRESVVNIVFTKKDGSQRRMKASLNPLYLPEVAEDAPAKNPAPNDLLVVQDIELRQWRSIRPETIITWSTTTEPVIVVDTKYMENAE